MTVRRSFYSTGAAVLALALTSCGGASDETKVKQTLMTEFTALANGDGATACAQATPAGQAKLASAVPGSNCAQVISLVSQRLPAQDKQLLRSARVNKVTIHGNTATVQNSDISTSGGSLTGVLGSGTTTLTKQSDGSWKISG